VKSINLRIAEELAVQERQVNAAVELLDEGSTVPFIARYRKEVTGGLDDSQLRLLEERLRYIRELEERRDVIVKSITEQEKMTPELAKQIQEADSKARLEDLYLPYRPKRRTKAQIAKEAGLEPLADRLFSEPETNPEESAAGFLNSEAGITDVKGALEGARQILIERFAETAALIGSLRDFMWDNARVVSKVVEGKQQDGAKFADYFDFEEALHKIPSHRALAMFRGREEGVLQLSLAADPVGHEGPGEGEVRIARHFGISDQGRAGDKWMADTVRWAWRTKISLHLDLELMAKIRDEAQEEAIRVFAENLRDLLLAAPAGPKAVIGLDPGYRTGVKTVVIDRTGKLLESTTIYPHEPQKKWDEALAILAALAARHGAELVAIGNGTASRETDRLAGELIQKFPETKLTKIIVSEAGASVYSASEFASKEFPDLDVSLRGAVSIARRLQDPLAELVKIDPKSIGVGQYQHDVSQVKLGRTLDAIVEDCVNAVGVDLNTASAPLLARVAGLSESVAKSIVAHRDEKGQFKERKNLLDVKGLGPKAFEQSAGFLRIMEGNNPLDASAVHPEAYPIVERIMGSTKLDIAKLLGNGEILKSLDPTAFTDEKFGEPTVKDILVELEKPGRDPRPEFKTAKFQEGIEKISDLKAGMILEGVVSNVANFGAFIDIGVHQDGLVHVSALSEKFVKDPRDVVRPGDIVRVKVLEVDLPRKRISLTMRMGDQAVQGGDKPTPSANMAKGSGKPGNRKTSSRGTKPQSAKSHSLEADNGLNGAMAAAFAKAGLGQKSKR